MALSAGAVVGRGGGGYWTSPSCISVLISWSRILRAGVLPGLPETAWFELAPDWVCEVLSPGTAADDRAEKLPIYAEHRVAHAQLIAPQLRALETFENHAGK